MMDSILEREREREERLKWFRDFAFYHQTFVSKPDTRWFWPLNLLIRLATARSFRTAAALGKQLQMSIDDSEHSATFHPFCTRHEFPPTAECEVVQTCGWEEIMVSYDVTILNATYLSMYWVNRMYAIQAASSPSMWTEGLRIVVFTAFEFFPRTTRRKIILPFPPKALSHHYQSKICGIPFHPKGFQVLQVRRRSIGHHIIWCKFQSLHNWSHPTLVQSF